ncbi:MAG: ATP-dependent sacrificial sulfur transferase LarE [Candidatus Bipolaricaulota bacterium]
MPGSLSQYEDEEKVASLKSLLEGYGSVLVGTSGGVDSGFLLKAAVDFLETGEVLAVTAGGAIHPEGELEDARLLARQLGAPWKSLEISYLEDESFRANPEDRCYHCKKDLFQRLRKVAEKEGLNEVVTGGIKDDLSAHRPGRQAGDELEVKRPLEEAGLTKEEIRKFGKEIGLPVWDKPSNSCLATRIPFGSEVTKEKLKAIEKAENYLEELGFSGFRVRHHDEIARIELRRGDFKKALEMRERLTERLKKVGYSYVTLDLEGYRSGSMLEAGDEESTH